MKDNQGCVVTTGITIGNLSAATFTTVVVAAKCDNQNGSITVTASGGTPAYTYSFDGGLTFSSSSNSGPVFPGNYTVVVKDGNGCLATKVVLVNDIVGPQTLTAVVTDASCGFGNGTVELTATGGTPPYQYSKDDITYLGSNLLTGFGAGTFTVWVRDVNLCKKSITVTIIDLAGPTITAVATPTTCGLNDGTITATSTGGTVPLLYSIDGVTFGTSNIFTGLGAGTYTITISDANGCSSNIDGTVTSPGAPTPTFDPVNPICAGDVLSALPTSSTDATPITGTWAPGLDNTTTTTYTFTPDGGQCATTNTLTITVNDLVSPTINCGTSTTSSVTFNWAAVVAATGYDVSYQINANPIVNIGAIGNVLTYAVTGLTENDTVEITVIPIGGAGTCFTSATATCTATGTCTATANIGPNQTICLHGTATFSATLTGTAPWSVTYSDGTTPTTVNNVNTNPYVFSVSDITSNATYTITGLSDSNCTATASDLTGAAVVSVINGTPGLWTGLISNDWFDCKKLGRRIAFFDHRCSNSCRCR